MCDETIPYFREIGKQMLSLYARLSKGQKKIPTWEVRSAAVKMAAAVTLLVSTGRASRRPRYHPKTPDPVAPAAPVFLLGGPKEGPGRAVGSGGGRGALGVGLEEMRWERKWDQGEGLGPCGLRRSGRRRRPPAWNAPTEAMAAAAVGFVDARRLRGFFRGFVRSEGKAVVGPTRQSLAPLL
jgi:hypothetical protein